MPRQKSLERHRYRKHGCTYYHATSWHQNSKMERSCKGRQDPECRWGAKAPTASYRFFAGPRYWSAQSVLIVQQVPEITSPGTLTMRVAIL
mmetsp:Transcript_6372/g.39758  ORF Transcript_6372/g.39758 Transcript_6372/m.39758 type:complete len:91 (-) Transcript_6372:1433-1705(-)